MGQQVCTKLAVGKSCLHVVYFTVILTSEQDKALSSGRGLDQLRGTTT